MPVRTTVEVNLDIPETLIKDLCENEAICQTCGGLGLVVRPNEYGLQEENKKSWRVSFPYRHESIFPCPSCYNGVVRLCQHCGKILPRGYTTCNCDQAWAEKREETRAAQLERWRDVPKIPFAEALTRFEMVYAEPAEEYFRADELFDRLSEYQGPVDECPIQRVYGTSTTSIALDAGSIIESACEELAESASDNISGDDEKELQELLDGWAEKHKEDTTTYYPEYGVGVLLPE